MEHLARFYLNWRRRALPPSVADIEWRHDLVAGRLDEMAGRLDEIGPALMLLHAPTAEEQRDVLEVLRMLEPMRVEGFEKIRVGAAGDGGYVQISDLDGITQALSFGIADEDSWDLAMAQAGVPVQQLDHSVERAPSTHPLLTFHRKMIGTQSSAESATLAELVAAYSKGGAPDIILKIDIEGCEWEVFAEADDATWGASLRSFASFTSCPTWGIRAFASELARRCPISRVISPPCMSTPTTTAGSAMSPTSPFQMCSKFPSLAAAAIRSCAPMRLFRRP